MFRRKRYVPNRHIVDETFEIAPLVLPGPGQSDCEWRRSTAGDQPAIFVVFTDQLTVDVQFQFAGVTAIITHHQMMPGVILKGRRLADGRDRSTELGRVEIDFDGLGLGPDLQIVVGCVRRLGDQNVVHRVIGLVRAVGRPLEPKRDGKRRWTDQLLHHTGGNVVIVPVQRQCLAKSSLASRCERGTGDHTVVSACFIRRRATAVDELVERPISDGRRDRAPNLTGVVSDAGCPAGPSGIIERLVTADPGCGQTSICGNQCPGRCNCCDERHRLHIFHQAIRNVPSLGRKCRIITVHDRAVRIDQRQIFTIGV